jgi:type VI secretion system protein ImpL
MEEFDALVAQINRLLPQRLMTEPDARRSLLYALPQQFAGLKDVVRDTLDAAFSASRFKEKPLLRGVYFTSGNAGGHALRPRDVGPVAPLCAARPPAGRCRAQQGRSYFLESLFKDVMFNESGLTGRNAKKSASCACCRPPACAPCCWPCGAALAWTLSYENNQRYLNEVADNAGTLRQAVEESKATDPDNVVALVPMLNHAARGAEQPLRGISPAGLALGLLQVPKVQTAAHATYLRLLEDAWLPRLSSHVARSLRQVSTGSPEASYETLKAYLMLYEPDHFDATFVKAWLRSDWENTLPQHLVQAGLVDQLSEHWTASSTAAWWSAQPIDANLVAEVRQRLAQMSPAQRAYSRLKQLLNTGDKLPPDFSVVRASGPEAPQVFARASGKPLTQGISGLFTYDGYHGLFLHELPRSPPCWPRKPGCWARPKAGAAWPRKCSRASWPTRSSACTGVRAPVGNLPGRHPPHTHGLAGAGRRAGPPVLSANSSLEQFIRAVARETTLARRPDQQEGGSSGSTSSWLGETAAHPRGTAPAQPPDRQAAERGRHAGHRHAGGRHRGLPLPRIPAPCHQQRLGPGAHHRQPAGAQRGGGRHRLGAPAGDPGRRRASSLSGTLEKVRSEAKRVPPPLNSMYEALATSTSSFAGSSVRTAGRQPQRHHRRLLPPRHPGPLPLHAQRHARRDHGRLRRLFATGGTMDEFFRTQLQTMVDISTVPWTFKQGVDGTPVGSASLAAFQRAASIRDVFFRAGGNTPGIRLEIKPLDMDASISQMVLDVDGEIVRYQHGPQIPKAVSWPGTRGTGQARLQITAAGAQNTGIVTEGPWALHRLFDRAQILPGNSPERFTAIFTIDGRKLRMEVTTSSVLNPFRLKAMEEFECPDRL